MQVGWMRMDGELADGVACLLRRGDSCTDELRWDSRGLWGVEIVWVLDIQTRVVAEAEDWPLGGRGGRVGSECSVGEENG